MDKDSEIKSHGFIARSLHWGFAVMYVYGLTKGLESVNQLSDSALWNFEMTFAALFLSLLLVRYFYMSWVGASALPQDTPVWKKSAAKIGHIGIYISTGMIAVSGLVIGGLYKLGYTNGVVIEGTIALHEFSLTASYCLIAVHILAAVYHRFLGDGIWSSMVPILKEK